MIVSLVTFEVVVVFVVGTGVGSVVMLTNLGGSTKGSTVVFSIKVV